MVRLRSFSVALAVIAGLLWPAAEAERACAGPNDRAALVVDTGAAVHTFCVVLPADSVSGLELIELASQQHGLTYELGFGGGAVCMLAGIGPTGGDCFEQYPEFWGYWRGTKAGEWMWSSTGAGSVTVTDGDVEGWSWGSGDGPDSHPAPPATVFTDVCAVIERDSEEGSKTRDRDGESTNPSTPEDPPDPEPTDEPVDEATQSDDKQERERPKKRADDERDPTPVQVAEAPAPTPTPEAVAASSEGGEGPPPAGIVAIAMAIAFAAAAVIVRRRTS
jgi:hypothetical protein